MRGPGTLPLSLSGSGGHAMKGTGGVAGERREFLCRIGVLASATALAPLAGCETAEMHTDPPQPGAKLDFDTAVDPYQPLATVGGKVMVPIGGREVLLLRISAAAIVAYDNECSHKQCKLEGSGQWDGASNQLKCTCHGAIFDLTGAPVVWPDSTPKVKLRAFKVTFDGAKGTVQT